MRRILSLIMFTILLFVFSSCLSKDFDESTNNNVPMESSITTIKVEKYLEILKIDASSNLKLVNEHGAYRLIKSLEEYNFYNLQATSFDAEELFDKNYILALHTKFDGFNEIGYVSNEAFKDNTLYIDGYKQDFYLGQPVENETNVSFIKSFLLIPQKIVPSNMESLGTLNLKENYLESYNNKVLTKASFRDLKLKNIARLFTSAQEYKNFLNDTGCKSIFVDEMIKDSETGEDCYVMICLLKLDPYGTYCVSDFEIEGNVIYLKIKEFTLFSNENYNEETVLFVSVPKKQAEKEIPVNPIFCITIEEY